MQPTRRRGRNCDLPAKAGGANTAAMTADMLTLLGGLGLFLFGMGTMTGALGALASGPARRALARFTRTPLTGVLTGAATTALVQSSSATTVTAIGFVGAGLLSFPQALGVVFGANIGTTFTGWIVMVLGFKLSVGTAALPLLLAGALGRIALGGRARRAAEALAGFAMLFLGLDMMQAGAAAFEGWLTPAAFPPDTWAGRAQMVALGALVTVVLQSSSAGVAMALTLLAAGAIGFPQAAALVIGMDIGTTATGLLATIGGSRAMRRTGVAHVVYNLATGGMAFLLLGVLAPAMLAATGDEQTALVAFHSTFNALGVAAILPVTARFARLLERLIPDEDTAIGPTPDARLLTDPDAALDAVAAQAGRIERVLFAALGAALSPGGRGPTLAATASAAAPALDDLRAWSVRIPLPEGRADPEARMIALLHQIDHLARLGHRCGQIDRLGPLTDDPALGRPARALGAALARVADGREAGSERLDRLQRLIAARALRRRAAVGPHPAGDVFARTDAARWLRRVALHAARIAHYGAGARPGA